MKKPTETTAKCEFFAIDCELENQFLSLLVVYQPIDSEELSQLEGTFSKSPQGALYYIILYIYIYTYIWYII